jgi:hypothetical protein
MELMRPVHKLPPGLKGTPYGEVAYYDKNLIVATADLSLILHDKTRAILVQDMGCLLRGFGPQVDVCKFIVRGLLRSSRKVPIVLGELESLSPDVKKYLVKNLTKDQLELAPKKMYPIVNY